MRMRMTFRSLSGIRDEVNGVRASDLRKRNAVHRGDLLGTGNQCPRLLNPNHHRRNQIAGTCRIVIQHPQDVVDSEPKPNLLLDLTQR